MSAIMYDQINQKAINDLMEENRQSLGMDDKLGPMGLDGCDPDYEECDDSSNSTYYDDYDLEECDPDYDDYECQTPLTKRQTFECAADGDESCVCQMLEANVFG